MKDRPNSNYILQVMRDGDVAHDPWGTAMAWGFACAENLHALGEDVPDELEYVPSPFGAVIESYEDFEVQSFIQDSDYFTAIADVKFAARCLSRYINWCERAGRSY